MKNVTDIMFCFSAISLILS
uniref:Uncharacterized protein n=1 Tax=Rhizophora mucronata TaxID=61149 RepID=A0A2P2PMN5_RHIMU